MPAGGGGQEQRHDRLAEQRHAQLVTRSRTCTQKNTVRPKQRNRVWTLLEGKKRGGQRAGGEEKRPPRDISSQTMQEASRRAHAPLKSSAASTRCATPPSTSEDPLSASASISVSVAGVTYSSSESYLQRQEDVQREPTMACVCGAASVTIKGMVHGHPNAPPSAVAALELARLLLTLNEGLLLQGAYPRTST